MRGQCGSMSQVRRKQRQLRVHIGARAIPAQQCIHRKGMPKIVDSRSEPACGLDAALMQERLDAIGDARTGVCAASLSRIPDQWRVWRRWKFQLCPGSKALLNLIRYAIVNRRQSRLVELRCSNMQRCLSPVVVSFGQIQKLATPERARGPSGWVPDGVAPMGCVSAWMPHPSTERPPIR
jgi:hypothetical protein